MYFRQHGVDVRVTGQVEAIERRENRYLVRTNDHKVAIVDIVIAGIGILPNVCLAEAAGLEVGDGILVDETLRTLDPDVFAAGDVANVPCTALKRRLRSRTRTTLARWGERPGETWRVKARCVSASADILFGSVRPRLRGGRWD